MCFVCTCSHTAGEAVCVLCVQVHKLLVKLAEVQHLEGVQDLYSAHTRVVLAGLKENYTVWTQHSLERHIFDTLLMESGEFTLTGSSQDIFSLHFCIASS